MEHIYQLAYKAIRASHAHERINQSWWRQAIHICVGRTSAVRDHVFISRWLTFAKELFKLQRHFIWYVIPEACRVSDTFENHEVAFEMAHAKASILVQLNLTHMKASNCEVWVSTDVTVEVARDVSGRVVTYRHCIRFNADSIPGGLDWPKLKSMHSYHPRAHDVYHQLVSKLSELHKAAYANVLRKRKR